MRALVTGASRGIGLELVRQLAARGDRVVAAARTPESASLLKELAAESDGRVEIVALDVNSAESVSKLEAAFSNGPLDLLINNAGVVGKMAPLEELDFDDMAAVYSTNALGALRVTRALLPRLRAGATKKIVNISTGMASLSDNGSGGAWAYRMAKAALNMATRNLGLALGREGFRVVAVNPGWVKTDMGGKGATMPVEESARRILAIVDGLSTEQNGSFVNHDGEPFPW
jgi:NAD(P)-dependent dehydrogenase (short-subunit alcohol dehydrogenase family)